MKNKTEKKKLICEYQKKIKDANKETTKKEIFKDLLHRLYSGNDEIEKLIDLISAGAEKTILNIPRGDKIHRGSADTFYNQIIIEFERDLKLSEKHAKEQLAGYLLGQVRSGAGYKFTLIVSDFITWKIFSPDISQIGQLENLTENTLMLNEVESARFILNEKNSEDFYYWIDQYLFREEKQKATLKGIKTAFGSGSSIHNESLHKMTKHIEIARNYGEVQVSYEQWAKFLSIAYGSFEANENIFLTHTYLSILSKILAYHLVSNNSFINDTEMKGIIDGEIFKKYNIQNFVDTDFFYWIKDTKSFTELKDIFYLINQEITKFDFSEVDEDILKGVYQELIDLDTRHTLGEYYTPDWLCEKVVQEFDFTNTDKILDPSCGSASFLRAAIHRIKQLNPLASVEEISKQIFGIDIHPLSVQIAKTTLLLAFGKDIQKATVKEPIYLNIIQANTILAPEGLAITGKIFKITIDQKEILLNTEIFDDIQIFDFGLEFCEKLASSTKDKAKDNIQTFKNNLIQKYKNKHFNQAIIDSFYEIYLALKNAKEQNRDSIWKFILQNLYKPYFLKEKFDYILGNPPWFTYSSIKNEEYQRTLCKIAEEHFVKPAPKNLPHLEIATIFLSYCNNYFLKDNGKLAFVLPRSFFNAEQHDQTRSGKAKGFRINSIWDLESVSPLFNIPSMVLFTEKSFKENNSLPSEGVIGKVFKGNLPSHNCNLQNANIKITEENCQWFYIKQGKSTAFGTEKKELQEKENPYQKLFKQGATITPRAFYFVDICNTYAEEKDWEKSFTKEDWKDREIQIVTSKAIQAEAKPPWKNLKFGPMGIDCKFLYKTALSKSILPFVLYKPDFVFLPITVETDYKGIKTLKIYSTDDLNKYGYPNESMWFQKTEKAWIELGTEKSRVKDSIQDSLNYYDKLTSQDLNKPYLVLYNASGKDANAVVIKRTDLNLEFIAESKAYVFYTDNLNEAYYLTAMLNSTKLNLMMKDFQTKGLFGARDIHKKILDIYFPKFDPKNTIHLKLSSLSKKVHEKAKTFLEMNTPREELIKNKLRRLRLEIKQYLLKEINEIDELLDSEKL